jgi:hypothetical protein
MAGSLIKIDEEIVTSTSSSVELGGADWDSSYDVYLVQYTMVCSTSPNDFDMRFLASGTAVTTANYDCAFKGLRTDTTFSNLPYTNETFFPVAGGWSVEENGMANTIYLFNFNNSSEYSFFTCEQVVYNSASSRALGVQGGGVYTVTEAHNGISIGNFNGGGTIESGTFTLYGLAK